MASRALEFRCGVALAIVAALFAAVVAPSPAVATVTIGSNLSGDPSVPSSCSPPCTMVQAAFPAGNQAPAGPASPVNGTIVAWRIRVGPDSGPLALRVIKRLSGGLSTGAGTSATVTPPTNATSTFSTNLPIAIGEPIGIDCCGAPFSPDIVANLTGGTRESWLPPLPDGDPGQAPTFTSQFYSIQMNADIEPTSAFTATVAPKKGGKVQVTANLPNPGTLAAGTKNDAGLASAAAKGKKVVYLKRMTAQVSAPGAATLVVKASKAARRQLVQRGRLRVKLKLVFTPTGGASSTQVTKVNLKR